MLLACWSWNWLYMGGKYYVMLDRTKARHKCTSLCWIIQSRIRWLKSDFGLVIGFTDQLQVVTTINCNNVPDFHSRKHSTLISSVYLHLPSRIYNTGTTKVSLNHTLPISLYYSTRKIFTDWLLILFCTPQAYCLLASATYYSLLQFTASRFGILLTYVDAARTRFTENTCHVTATYFCGDVIAPAPKCVYRAVV
jgi:hypothetical protein